ncbi:hypothetical protein Pint_06004 [Pistacia integerrima]|uniref:Uncharacterized protein n=1 Tax=Pistacia integerrima TaxID=434235 RepID=A0ACC0Z818_9ROSI|nr:hypothetical protein Pint_06004 [Pistacia integerrima]
MSATITRLSPSLKTLNPRAHSRDLFLSPSNSLRFRLQKPFFAYKISCFSRENPLRD